jgi:DNA-binding NarL/FixJ family response regulator
MRTVLIVDDHPTFRRFARRLLEQAGFAVVGEAGNAAAALERTQVLRPEAVLLDVILPDASGLQVATELAEARHQPAVVLTSSRSERDLGVTLGEAPTRGFIPKASFTGAAFAELVA